jgi:hypothetical protein
VGGNNPNMSKVLSGFGLEVVSFGAYGRPELDPVFLPLSKQCRLVSFSNPGKCTAYEFSVSKVLNFYNMDKKDFTWENLTGCIDPDEIFILLDKSDMIIFVNLGEQPAVLTIIEKLYEEIFPRFTEPKMFFIDFADCSHMNESEISRAFGLIKKINSFGTVTVSVNENEYYHLSNRAGTAVPNAEVRNEDLNAFRKALGAGELILRTLGTFYFSSASEATAVPNEFVPEPGYLTGAGDAQNAGFCIAKLNGLSAEDMLLAGVRAGNMYLRTGEVNSELIENYSR